MDHAADYEEAYGEPHSRFERWVVPALIISILLHVIFAYWAKDYLFTQASQEYFDRVVPRTFHLERVDIDPKLLDPEPSEIRQSAAAPEAVTLPDEKASLGELTAETKGPAAAPKFDSPLLNEKPMATSTTLEETVRTAKQNGAESVLQDSQALNEAILSESPDVGGKSYAEIVSDQKSSGRALVQDGPLRGGSQPGFSNLDQLLAQTGPLSPETAPILMPTDLLFDYNKSDLQATALASLEKLGTLIQRNPQATFAIEGHSDSFGPDDYNMLLSQKRADAVKLWLIQVMRIPENRVSAQGFGKTRLIAPASGTIEEQQINRRVEIVIRAPKSGQPSAKPTE